MSALFLEKAIWGFFALVASLIAVIYKLFSGSLNKDLLIKKNEIRDELEVLFEKEFISKISILNGKIEEMKKEIESFKRHENKNFQNQSELMKELLKKLDEKK
jgi:hypothetical protein